jgi:alpha-mannosidase II
MNASGSILVKEVAMRITTSIKAEGDGRQVFYTDSNGFQMTRRTYFHPDDHAANFYPVTSAVYVQGQNLAKTDGSRARVTLLTGQPHAATSSSHSSSEVRDEDWRASFIEVMMDRAVPRDDNKGMGEGMMDSKDTHFKFALLVEDVIAEKVPGDAVSEMLLSPTAMVVSRVLNHPAVAVLYPSGKRESRVFEFKFEKKKGKP